MIGRYLRRVSRSAGVLVTCLLLSCTVLASVQISEQASSAVSDSVDENWRGHYDLLVTAAGELGEAADQTGGLIEQNFSALATTEGISGAQLEEISAMPSVEVAAPLAFIGQFATPALSAPLGAAVPGEDDAGFFDHPRAFKGSVSTYYDDGMELRHLQSRPADSLFLTGTGWNPTGGGDRPSMKVFDVRESIRCECSTWSWSTSTYEGLNPHQVYETVEVVPQLYSTMVAVDPAAEAELLGGGTGFLDALAEFEQLAQSEDAECPPGTAEDSETCVADLVDPDRYPHIHERAAQWQAEDGPILPIVYSETEYPDLTAEAHLPQLSTFEDATFDNAQSYQHYGEVLYDDPPALEDPQRIDLSEHLVPFVPRLDVGFALEGAQPPSAPQTADSAQINTDWTPGRVERRQASDQERAEAPPDVAAALVNEPQGFYVLDAERTAREQRYRPWERNLDFDARPPYGTLLAPVGSYTPGVDVDVDSASYVPLGLYADAESQIVSGEYAGRPLPPSFSGRGALLSSPGVITTLGAYEAYRGERRADVVRVRVAGVDSYSAEGRQRITETAEAIESLGLDVQVVAGSSLAPVAVYLPEFFEDGRDLGWTVEEWTSLGAATGVEEAQLSASWLLLGVSVAGVAVLASAVQLAHVPARRREASTLVFLGWTRRRVRRWFIAEDLPAVLLVSAVAVGAALASPTTATWLAGTAAAVIFLSAVIAGAAGALRSPRVRTPRADEAQPARGPASVGFRLGRSAPGIAALMALSLTVLTTTAVMFLLVIAGARTRAGVSRLAALVNAEVLLPQTMLAVSAAAAGTIMLVMAVRRSMHQARAAHQMLRTAGWPRSSLRAAVRTQLATVGAPGAVAAVALGAAGGAAVAPELAAPVAAAAVGVPALAALGALVWAAGYVRQEASATGQ
ncbi:hypothetical protein [Nesterenkonia sp.]|uniref:hypothetical protein n=1 Tax=Nesterenkonia sp. TaxID=704201 RepID=UPI0026124370|nr:hypothetical protein [Nesterenkonia sp.]